MKNINKIDKNGSFLQSLRIKMDIPNTEITSTNYTSLEIELVAIGFDVSQSTRFHMLCKLLEEFKFFIMRELVFLFKGLYLSLSIFIYTYLKEFDEPWRKKCSDWMEMTNWPDKKITKFFYSLRAKEPSLSIKGHYKKISFLAILLWSSKTPSSLC